jgi:colanic acid biosynthesis glycosyl transferase WcaI
MANVIFVNRYFFPDHSATSQILSDLAFHLAATGYEVHIVASRHLYDDPNAALPEAATVKGATVHRVASTRFGRTGLAGRMLDYASFYQSARHLLSRLVRRGDIVVVKTDPPLLSLALASIVRRRGARLINWLQDVYPETAIVLGVPLLQGPVAPALVALRNRSLREAAINVVVGKLMARRLEQSGVPSARIRVIANWCNDEAIRPTAAERNPLREEWQLVGKFVVGYSGNLGRAHDFETVLGAAERLRSQSHIVFMMIGGGKRFDDLAKAVKARGLENSFRFQPYQELATLPYSLGVPDVHWLSLDPKLEGLMVPSKFYGIAAAGKPIVMIGESKGEIGRLVREHQCGTTITPGDTARLADKLRHWSEDPLVITEMGAKARQMLDAQFTRHRALDDWSRVIEQVQHIPNPV